MKMVQCLTTHTFVFDLSLNTINPGEGEYWEKSYECESNLLILTIWFDFIYS